MQFAGHALDVGEVLDFAFFQDFDGNRLAREVVDGFLDLAESALTQRASG